MTTPDSRFPKTISFIVLALDEAEMIEKTVETVTAAVSASTASGHEIVLVDDGSTDGTGAIMDGMAARMNGVKVLHNERNLGFGAAYLRGVSAATQEYVMIIAGDNIMPGTSITAIVDSIGQTDMVLPYMTDASFREPVRRYGSRIFSQIINLMAGNSIRYYNGMVARSRLFEGVRIGATGYSLQAECVCKFLRSGATYREIGVVCGHQTAPKSTSKALRLKNLKNLFKSLWHLYGELQKTPSRPKG